MINQNSLLYWFPKIASLGIPVPCTTWVEFPPELGRNLLYGSRDDVRAFQPYLEMIQMKAKVIGYPVFIRTDQASNKHNWKRAAFVRNEEEMMSHILETLEFNELAGVLGLNYKAIVIREFLELDWRFKAFYGEMPVARERRYFIKDIPLCHHPYWINEAILKAHGLEGKKSHIGYFPHKLPNKWEAMLEELNVETEEETSLLSRYASLVAKAVEGYWSVDFAYTREGVWYLIDMAVGYDSWHPDCEFKLERTT